MGQSLKTVETCPLKLGSTRAAGHTLTHWKISKNVSVCTRALDLAPSLPLGAPPSWLHEVVRTHYIPNASGAGHLGYMWMLVVEWINVGVSEMGSQARSSVMPPRTWPQLVHLPDGPWEAQKGVPSEVTGSELLAGPDKTQGSQTPQSFSEYLLSIRHWAYRM